MKDRELYGIKDKVIFVVLAILVYITYDLINASFFHLFAKVLGNDNSVDVYLIDSFANFFLLIIYYFIFSHYLKENKNSITIVKTSTQKYIMTMIKYLIIAFGLGGISSAWFLAVDSFLYKISIIGQSYQKMMEASSGMDESSFIFVFLSAVIISPIVEELLFRGIIFNLFRKITSKIWIPIMLSSLAFGFWHGILVQDVYATILGIIFAIIYYKTQNIWICIFIHIINNFISTVFTTAYFENFYFYLGLFQLAFAIPCIYLVYKLSIRKY